MRRFVLVLLWGCLAPLPAWALAPGDSVAPWTLLDQYDQPYTADDRLRVLLVARSMAASGLVKEALRDQPAGLVVAYLADISGMPAPIAQLFALPEGYRVLLDREGRIAPRFAGPADQVLWVRLDRGRHLGQRAFGEAAALLDEVR